MLYQSIDEAYQRRGMAFHVVGVMDWLTHEKLREFLIGALRKDLVEGREEFKPISYHEMIALDRYIFVQLARMCTHGIRDRAEAA